MKRQVLANGPQMSGDQLTDVEIISIIAKWVLNGLSNLQPAKEENEPQDQEDGHKGVGFIGLGLSSNQS